MDTLDKINNILLNLNKNNINIKSNIDNFLFESDNILKNSGNDKDEQNTICFNINDRTKRLIESVMSKYPGYTINQFVKVLSIYSLCVLLDKQDTRKKLFVKNMSV